jgi:hypothetical protein
MQGSNSMSIAAEHVAGRQRLRERLTAVTLETKLAVRAFVAIAVPVLDDNFFQPQPGASPLDHRVHGFVPVAVVSVAAARSCLKPTAKKVALQVIANVDRSVKEDRHE